MNKCNRSSHHNGKLEHMRFTLYTRRTRNCLKLAKTGSNKSEGIDGQHTKAISRLQVIEGEGGGNLRKRESGKRKAGSGYT